MNSAVKESQIVSTTAQPVGHAKALEKLTALLGDDVACLSGTV